MNPGASDRASRGPVRADHPGSAPGGLATSGSAHARNPLWCQSISDATDLPVTAPDTPEIGARGAILAAPADLGAGTLPELIGDAVRPGSACDPRPVTFRIRWHRSSEFGVTPGDLAGFASCGERVDLGWKDRF
jgi:hypothetical protein